MARFSLEQLRRVAEEPLRTAVRKDAQAILRDAAAQDQRSSHDIFLSHNHLDKAAVLGLKTLLERSGYAVYVDSESDPQLDPNKVNALTVEVVRRRLRGSRSLLYATSENAAESKWMAWELGLGDGLGKRVAIVPVIGATGALATREFLLVYPEVQGGPGELMSVRRADGTSVSFAVWLRGG
jgi:hypothetical protein